jgi:DNA recombination protein RmuC
MDSTLIAILILILGLAVGGALGWFVGSRPAAELRVRLEENEAEARELDARFRHAAQALGDASVENATLKANAASFEQQKAGLLIAQDSLKREFEAAGAKILAQAQEALLNRAHERMSQSEEKSAERLKALLAPVDQRLKSYEEQVSLLEQQRVDAFGQLHGVIRELREGQNKVREEAARLGNSLRNAPKARGRWGEQQLRNVLEQCGLAEHTDFVTEHSVDTEDGRLRPDAVIRIPGQKSLIIDAKVSLNAYQEAFEAQDDGVRDMALAAHVASMRGHVQQLGAKSYQSQFDDTPDYVVMFVPGEHFVAAALEHDPELWDFAFHNKVLLATPTNLVAIARTVAMVWKQDMLAREAVEIGKAGAELYDRLAVAAEHLKRVGSGLEGAVTNYNKFVSSFERNVLTSGRRLKDKGIAIGKREIEDVPLIDSGPRHGGASDPPMMLTGEPGNDTEPEAA